MSQYQLSDLLTKTILVILFLISRGGKVFTAPDSHLFSSSLISSSLGSWTPILDTSGLHDEPLNSIPARPEIRNQEEPTLSSSSSTTSASFAPPPRDTSSSSSPSPSSSSSFPSEISPRSYPGRSFGQRSNGFSAQSPWLGRGWSSSSSPSSPSGRNNKNPSTSFVRTMITSRRKQQQDESNNGEKSSDENDSGSKMGSNGNNDQNKDGTKPSFTGNIFPDVDGLVKGEFVSKKVVVSLSCEPEETLVRFNFTQPFRGVIQAGDTTSPCKIRGDGKKFYSLGVPHHSCGTKHVSSSGSFFNTLFIRYHPSLEMEGDQLKSIVCKFGTGSISVG